MASLKITTEVSLPALAWLYESLLNGVNHEALFCGAQSAILAVGATKNKVVAQAGGGFGESAVMSVTMSCDHRVVDGALGAQWLQAFRGYIEDPATMLL